MNEEVKKMRNNYEKSYEVIFKNRFKLTDAYERKRYLEMKAKKLTINKKKVRGQNKSVDRTITQNYEKNWM